MALNLPLKVSSYVTVCTSPKQVLKSVFNWIMGLKLFYRTYCKEAVKIQSYIYIYRTVAIKTYAGMYLNLGFLYKPESPNISFSYMYQSNWKNIFDKLFHFRWSHF